MNYDENTEKILKLFIKGAIKTLHQNISLPIREDIVMKSLKNYSKKQDIFEVKTTEMVKKDEFVNLLAGMLYSHVQKNHKKGA